jgi:gas vesicle protein
MDYDRPTTKKQSNVVGVALIAAAVGAVAGMLLAPKKGSETREDLMGKYNDAKNKTQDTVNSTKDKLNRGVDAARGKVHDAADKTKDVADNAADKAKDATSRHNTAQTTSLADEIAAAERSKRGRSSL